MNTAEKSVSNQLGLLYEQQLLGSIMSEKLVRENNQICLHVLKGMMVNRAVNIHCTSLPL